MAPPPPELIDDAATEILLRLPPDEPEHLFRAALVCKPWLRILCDPAFRRRYRAFHGAPPLLGLLNRLEVQQGFPPVRFASTTSMPDFPYPGSDGGRPLECLDCRHGRVLFRMLEGPTTAALIVWDPVTGDKHSLVWPAIDWLIFSASVVCATDGCDHLDCHGGPSRVLFMATDNHDWLVKVCLYSSETGVWSTPVSLDDSCDWYVQPSRAAVIGDEIYFTLQRGNAIIKYDVRNNCLSMINPPPHNAYRIALMVMDDSSLGFVCIEGSGLYLWSRKVSSEGAAEWVQCRVIELKAIVPVVDPGEVLFVVGAAEGVGAIFISTHAGLFTIEIKSGRVRKVDEPGEYFSVLPYMSFYTPDHGRLLSLARASYQQ